MWIEPVSVATKCGVSMCKHCRQACSRHPLSVASVVLCTWSVCACYTVLHAEKPGEARRGQGRPDEARRGYDVLDACKRGAKSPLSVACVVLCMCMRMLRRARCMQEGGHDVLDACKRGGKSAISRGKPI